jgi:diguanylate cyclase (GGDEF)-like protein
MSDEKFDQATEHFVQGLDKAAQCHLLWMHRVLRCAVLRTSPGEDVLAEDAHNCCSFGLWLHGHRRLFDQIDTVTVRHLRAHHRQMHDAARSICRRVLEDRGGDAGELSAFERTCAAVVADLALLKTEYLAHSARLDALTGLPLRHGLEEEFQRCHSQAQRHSEKMVVLMLDLDQFKRANDEYGHAAGDLALRHVATLLRRNCRAGEPVFRFGGEEFLAFLQAADSAVAERAAGRILQALRDNALHLPDGRTLSVRASAGMAEVGATEPMADAVARADRALYAAKAAGRDTWRWAPPT